MSKENKKYKEEKLAHQTIYNLLNQAKKEAPEEYSCYLTGDLAQQSTQMNLLQSNGISVKVNGGRPVIQDKDYNKALQLIYDTEIERWWNYHDTFINCGICTKTQWKKKWKDRK